MYCYYIIIIAQKSVDEFSSLICKSQRADLPQLFALHKQDAAKKQRPLWCLQHSAGREKEPSS